MAILHDATLTPGKRELMKGWLPSRPWFDGDLDRKPHAAFRFDDPAGEVGIECFLLGPEEGSDASTLLIPMSYRGTPLDGAEEHLIGTADHSVLGKRWVYDGCGDPVAVSAILSATVTGGHEAPLTMEQDGETVTFEPTCRVSGSGSASDAVHAGSVSIVDAGDPTISSAGDLELVLARVIGTEVSGHATLTAQWGDHGPVVVAAARRSA
jgi:Maltokinase N-terminal cap domain